MFQPVTVAPAPLPRNPDRLRILPLTDLHLPKSASHFILENRALLDSIDYVVLLGDMVSAYGTDREYGAVRDFVEGLGRPYTAVMGNHEWHFEEFHEDSGLYGQVWNAADSAEQRAKIEKFRAFYRLADLWRAFESPLGRFVFLSLYGVGEPKQETLGAQQIRFLLQHIQAAAGEPLFVFCHAPLMLDERLDMTYYDERTGCVEARGQLKAVLLNRQAPTFWMSGHVHLHPDHYLFAPYKAGGNVWQIHCPDSWGYGRWLRIQHVPDHYDGPYSRVLEIDPQGVTFLTHVHREAHVEREAREVASFRVDF